MSNPSASRLALARTPSLLKEAEGRRKTAELMGWTFVLFIVSGALVNAIMRTSQGLVDIVRGAKSAARTGGKMDIALSDILRNDLDARLRDIVAEVSSRMETWGEAASTQAEVLLQARDVHRKLDNIDHAFAPLQDNFAKSASVGSEVGVSTWDLDQRQAKLLESHNRVMSRISETNELVQHNVEKYKLAEEQDMGDDNSRAQLEARESRWRQLIHTVKEQLALVNIEDLKAQVKSVREALASTVEREDAETMVDGYAADAADFAVSGVLVMDEEATPGEKEVEGVSNDEIHRLTREALEFIIPHLDQQQEEECMTERLARLYTKAQLERYGADRTGIPDYAMGPAGAQIVESMTSPTYSSAAVGWMERLRNLARKPERKSIGSPHIAIQPESRLGRCWPMAGSRGRLTVKLSTPIVVEALSIEHAAREILLNGGKSAPKDFSVIGYEQGSSPGPAAMGDVLITGAQYDLEGEVIQFFQVPQEFQGTLYSIITLEVESNHGEPAYTCLYRLRVHGTPPEQD